MAGELRGSFERRGFYAFMDILRKNEIFNAPVGNGAVAVKCRRRNAPDKPNHFFNGGSSLSHRATTCV